MQRLFALFCAFLLSAPAVGQEGELLEPEQAFRFSARVIDGETLGVRYDVAEGYYLYRDKLRFELEGAGVALDAPRIPPGKKKKDEFFGEVETLRNGVDIVLPLRRSDGAAAAVVLKAVSQGCADAGVCYTPMESRVELKLTALPGAPGAAPAAPPSGGLAALKAIGGGLGGGAEGELLPPEEAFKVSAAVQGAATVVARFTPAQGYYLYRDKISFAAAGQADVAVEGVDLPRGEMKSDPSFGEVEVFHKPFDATVRLRRTTGGEVPLRLQAKFQGCADIGVCYVPMEQTFDLLLPAAAAGGPSPAAAQSPAAPADESAQVAAVLGSGSFWAVVAGFFGFGLLLALTPCVLPMIPILSGIIVGQGHKVTKLHGFLLSASYVLGMAITYALAGVAAGLSGSMLSAALQNPWVLGGFAAVFVALSLSMFGFYELQMPNFIQSRLTETSNRLHGGHHAAVFVMGVLSAVIVGPCVAAPLAGALLYISQTRDVVLGGVALFTMALGMGVPLLAVGASAGALLPKAGAWMNGVKNFFGVLLLGVAIWMISPLIPAVVHMLLWAALLICSAVYLHALDPLPPGAHGWRKLWKGVGVLALLTGIGLLVGAMSGGRDILQPLSSLRTSPATGAAASAAHALPFQQVATVAELDARVAGARGRFVMLDFYADWCVSCKELERFTFSDPRVQARLADVLLLQADVTANTAEHKALLKRFSLFGPPGIVFFDREGRELPSPRIVGFQDADKFLASLDAAFGASPAKLAALP